ncbi:MAG TPA: ABC transporter ATP-binding protein [Anaerolineales bacterium]|nr:ABC transporter ATP-binding protein [Anaerolineales bacterium]
MRSILKVMDVHQDYEGRPLLDGISFSLQEFETICLLGASGSGKSTLLRIIAGLEIPDSGSISWNGQDLSTIPAYKRKFGLMFQDYALFPFLTVEENIMFGMKIQNMKPEAIKDRIADVLDLVELEGFEHRDVLKLSGGEQQRVALARTLAPQPRLLMLDEPLGALDFNLKEHLMSVLRKILRSNRVPVIYVTHDQEEAFELADRILIIKDGRIINSGTPHELWENPGSSWTANFLGLGNILPAKWVLEGEVETILGVLKIRKCEHDHQPGENVEILVRPDAETSAAGYQIEGQVEDIQFTKKGFKVRLTTGQFFFLGSSPVLGEIIRIKLPSNAVVCLG